jgi:hypothetical protein
LEGVARRAIDIHEGEKVDGGALQALVKAAVAQNGPPVKAGANAKPGASEAKPIKVRKGEKVAIVLFSREGCGTVSIFEVPRV